MLSRADSDDQTTAQALARIHGRLGRVLLERGNADGRPFLEQAIEAMERPGEDADLAAWYRFLLGRLVHAGGDRAAGRALVQSARDRLAKSRSHIGERAPTIDEWLRANP